MNFYTLFKLLLFNEPKKWQQITTASYYRRKKWNMVGFSILGVLLVLTLWRSNPVKVACQQARLPYPPGKILHRKNAQGPFSGTSAFSFTASRSQIEKWLSHCKEIEPQGGIAYTRAHYLIFKSIEEISQLMNSDRCNEFHLVSMDSGSNNETTGYEIGRISDSFPWFTPHITHGVRYDIPQNDNADYGEIFVDWDTNTVWVTGSHS